MSFGRRATQTVFGEGKAQAEVMLVGEQPGNDEDLAGHPLSGQLGDIERCPRAGPASNATVLRDECRQNTSNGSREASGGFTRSRKRVKSARAVRGSMQRSRRAPRHHRVSGATAAKELLGNSFKVSVRSRPVLDSPLAPLVTATVHRLDSTEPDSDARREAMKAFVRDLKKVAARL